MAQVEGWDLLSIPEENRSYEICLYAIQILRPIMGNNQHLLSFLPIEYLRYEMCFASVQNVGRSLECVPMFHRDKALCIAAVRSDGEATPDVPKHLQDIELYRIAVDESGEAIIYVPHNSIDKEMAITAMKSAPRLYHRLPEHLRKDYDVCYTAVRYKRDTITEIPIDIKKQMLS